MTKLTDLNLDYIAISDAWNQSQNIVLGLLAFEIQSISFWLLLIGIMLLTFETITRHVARGAVELLIKSHRIVTLLKYAALLSMGLISSYLCFWMFKHYQNSSEVLINTFQLLPIFLYFIFITFIAIIYLFLILLTKLIGQENYVVGFGAICTTLSLYMYVDQHFGIVGGLISLIVFTLIFALWSYGRIHNLGKGVSSQNE